VSFPRYLEYRESGAAWLGDVPAHWEISPARRQFSNMRVPSAVGDDQLTASQKYGVIPQSLFMSLEDQKVALALSGTSSFKRVEKGDFVISLRSFQGGIELSRYRGCVSPAYTVLRPSKSLVWDYYAYLLKSEGFVGALQSMTDGLRDGKAISYGQFGSLLLPLPEPSEQFAIAAFLDRETTKIDALVSEQQRLIELLKEKRQAVISHAVTKGLNPDAPMKPSGVHWLGDVPAHWDVLKMKWVAKMQSGHTPDKKVEAYWADGDIPWVSLNDTGFLKDNDYIDETAFNITQAGLENSSARLLPPKVVVFSRDATIGRCAITTRSMTVSQHFIAWVCGDSIVPEYLLQRLRSMTGELERLTTGATLKTIGMPDVRTLLTPVPPLAEQVAIVEHVQGNTDALDTLVDETQSAIDLLRERRAALISAAVTGQIDVRGLVEREAA
jgi:type I restriction enzyme S subunit